MSSRYSTVPIWLGHGRSGMVVVMSLLSIRYALRLTVLQPSNVVWTYLLWLCVALFAFSLSRGVGHIAMRLLLLADSPAAWIALKPCSGGINTIIFVIVASITMFFQRVYMINKDILNDKKALELATGKVLHLNRNLESLVQHRTEELSRSEGKFRRIFEGSMDMIFLLNRHGRFLDINRAGLNTLGYDRELLVGKLSLGDLAVSPQEFRNLIEDLDRNGFVKDRECKLRHKEGEELHLLLSATARKDESSGSRATRESGKT